MKSQAVYLKVTRPDGKATITAHVCWDAARFLRVRVAGHWHAFMERGEIDVHGIAVTRGVLRRPVFKTRGNTNIGMECMDVVGGEGCKVSA